MLLGCGVGLLGWWSFVGIGVWLWWFGWMDYCWGVLLGCICVWCVGVGGVVDVVGFGLVDIGLFVLGDCWVVGLVVSDEFWGWWKGLVLKC